MARAVDGGAPGETGAGSVLAAVARQAGGAGELHDGGPAAGARGAAALQGWAAGARRVSEGPTDGALGAAALHGRAARARHGGTATRELRGPRRRPALMEQAPGQQRQGRPKQGGKGRPLSCGKGPSWGGSRGGKARNGQLSRVLGHGATLSVASVVVANFPKLGGKARCVTMATRYFVTAVML